jgi:hypothetical protein
LLAQRDRPITANGSPATMPISRKVSGSSTNDSSTSAAAIAKLIHQRARSRIANNEFSAIFTVGLLPCTCGICAEGSDST